MGLVQFVTQHRQLGIKRNDVVIDIGSGNNPILRADILVDKYVFTDQERYSGIVLDRTVVSAAGEKLPFRDKSIDFVYCSHVLEHIPQAAQFIDEIQRVGKRGIFITPQGDYEKLDPRVHHLWCIWSRDGKLLLKQKDCWDEYPELSKYFSRVIGRSHGYWKFYDRNFEQFNTIHPWENEINYEIIQPQDFDFKKFEVLADKDGFKPEVTLEVPVKFRVKSLVGKVIRPLISSRVHLNKILCCPECRGELTDLNSKTDKVRCHSCGAEYPVQADVILMSEDR